MAVVAPTPNVSPLSLHNTIYFCGAFVSLLFMDFLSVKVLLSKDKVRFLTFSLYIVSIKYQFPAYFTCIIVYVSCVRQPLMACITVHLIFSY